MVKTQPDDDTNIQDVLTWAKGARQLGIGDAGLEIDRPFIPEPDIEAYFEDIQRIQKLLAALFPNGAPQVHPETIRKKYTKVFLTLLLTGHGQFIKLFVRYDSLCDRYLPFRFQPAHFPQSTTDADFFTSFYHQQWEFCAPSFQYRVDVQFDDKDLILPIISKEKLGGGGSAIIHKIKVHPAYNMLGREGSSRDISTDQDTHTFVLKTYNTADAERYYHNEVNGFLNLGINTNIIGFHGSFVWDGTYNVLLEYADRGTLEQYFHPIPPPSSGEGTTKFWRELFRTLGALAAIHGVWPSDPAASSGFSMFQGWHQDVKSSNILVKSKGISPYDCELKLADLGLSHVKCSQHLANAPATFQAYVNKALKPYIDVFCVVYLDDVLIYSETEDLHWKHVRKVLRALLEHRLYAKLSKCAFNRSEVTFLGFVVNQRSIRQNWSYVIVRMLLANRF